jgi:hypothetical protein
MKVWFDFVDTDKWRATEPLMRIWVGDQPVRRHCDFTEEQDNHAARWLAFTALDMLGAWEDGDLLKGEELEWSRSDAVLENATDRYPQGWVNDPQRWVTWVTETASTYMATGKCFEEDMGVSYSGPRPFTAQMLDQWYTWNGKKKRDWVVELTMGTQTTTLPLGLAEDLYLILHELVEVGDMVLQTKEVTK